MKGDKYMNCPNCNRELLEGEYCNCTANQTAQTQAPPVQTPPEPQTYYNPMPIINPQPRTDYPQGYKIKKKYVAVILAALLGPFGIHNFYLGKRERGTAQLLLCTVGSLLFGLGAIAAAIWAIVEAVQLLTEDINADAEGYKIQTLDEAFRANNQ